MKTLEDENRETLEDENRELKVRRVNEVNFDAIDSVVSHVSCKLYIFAGYQQASGDRADCCAGELPCSSCSIFAEPSAT